MAENEKPVRNWGKPFAIISLVFGIISLFFGLLALIPIFGMVYGIITLIVGIIAISFGIPGVIGSRIKSTAVVGLVFGGVSLFWGTIRTIWTSSVIQAASTQTTSTSGSSETPSSLSYHMNVDVSVKNVQFNVKNVYNSKDIGTYPTTTHTSYNYAVVSIDIKNNNSSSLSVLSQMVTYHIGENVYEPDSSGLYLDGGFYLTESIGAGLSKNIKFVYEIPANYTTSDYILVKDSSMSLNSAKIYLHY